MSLIKPKDLTLKHEQLQQLQLGSGQALHSCSFFRHYTVVQQVVVVVVVVVVVSSVVALFIKSD